MSLYGVHVCWHVGMCMCLCQCGMVCARAFVFVCACVCVRAYLSVCIRVYIWMAARADMCTCDIWWPISIRSLYFFYFKIEGAWSCSRYSWSYKWKHAWWIFLLYCLFYYLIILYSFWHALSLGYDLFSNENTEKNDSSFFCCHIYADEKDIIIAGDFNLSPDAKGKWFCRY